MNLLAETDARLIEVTQARILGIDTVTDWPVLEAVVGELVDDDEATGAFVIGAATTITQLLQVIGRLTDVPVEAVATGVLPIFSMEPATA